jgi:glycosyltransferase involved in cell wall biosynthesis
VMPKLSVVFAHKDRNGLLSNTLACWRKQTVLPPGEIELIVVDDGSRVLPTAECAEFGARVLPIQGEPTRKGPSVAWNAGLRIASGEVIACTHPEIAPGRDCARFLYGACAGDPVALEGIRTWLPEPVRPGAIRVTEGEVFEWDFDRLRAHAVRANVSVLRLRPGQGVGDDPDSLGDDPAFWNWKTEFGGHTNAEIRYRFRGFFWNNMFAYRSSVWRWMNYFRPSGDWGIDDTDIQERNRFLQIAYAFGNDGPFGYHQAHEPGFRSGVDDLHKFTSLDDARLCFLYPDTAGEPCPLNRGEFWSDR